MFAARLKYRLQRSGKRAGAVSAQFRIDIFQSADQINDFAPRVGAARGGAKMCAASEGSVLVDEAACGGGSKKGQDPSVFAGNIFRPVAFHARAAKSASPRVREGVFPVSLKWQHSVRSWQSRSSGREANSR